MAMLSYEKDGSVIKVSDTRLVDLKQGVEIVPSNQVKMLQLKEAADAAKVARGSMIAMEAQKKKDDAKRLLQLKKQMLRDQLVMLTEAARRIVERKAKGEVMPYSSMEGLPVDSLGRVRKGY